MRSDALPFKGFFGYVSFSFGGMRTVALVEASGTSGELKSAFRFRLMAAF